MTHILFAELEERGGGGGGGKRRGEANLSFQDLEAARERVWRKRRAVPSAMSSSDCFVRAAGDPIAEYRQPVFEWEMRRDVWFLWDFVPPNANTEMRDKHPTATFEADQKMLEESLNRLKKRKSHQLVESSSTAPLPQDQEHQQLAQSMLLPWSPERRPWQDLQMAAARPAATHEPLFHVQENASQEMEITSISHEHRSGFEEAFMIDDGSKPLEEDQCLLDHPRVLSLTSNPERKHCESQPEPRAPSKLPVQAPDFGHVTPAYDQIYGAACSRYQRRRPLNSELCDIRQSPPSPSLSSLAMQKLQQLQDPAASGRTCCSNFRHERWKNAPLAQLRSRQAGQGIRDIVTGTKAAAAPRYEKKLWDANCAKRSPGMLSWDAPRSPRRRATGGCTSKTLGWTHQPRSNHPNSRHRPQSSTPAEHSGHTSMAAEPSTELDKFAKVLVKLKGKFEIANGRIKHRYHGNS